jgi:2-polyprenyl-3-methyl-5-hydroxy-6-metoxy-1,4-benzoquinol methylase
MRIPFSLHRRLPLVRRPFSRRDMLAPQSPGAERRPAEDDTAAQLNELRWRHDLAKQALAALAAGRSSAETTTPSRAGLPVDPYDPAYTRHMHRILMRWKYVDMPEEFLASEQFPIDLAEHTYHRVDRFSRCLVPWIKPVISLNGARVIEVGSGTGSSTLAFAPHVGHIHCFELEENPTKIARERLGFWGLDNVTFEPGLFGPGCDLLVSHPAFDVVLLIAVLEHVHFHEFKAIVGSAFNALRPGGIIVIAETPNRLSFHDSHSSFIDFFQWLPPEVKAEYYQHSPREHFVYDVGSCIRAHGADSPELGEKFARWGRGVSFHDFEIVLGRDVHNMIALDGWEEEIKPLAPVKDDDEVLLDIFKRTGTKANKAFARSWLYMVVRKPE